VRYFNTKKTDSLKSQKVIITGGPGFGKTSIVEELEARKYACAHEVSRSIIKEQLESGGDILPWKNLARFSELLLESRLKQFEETFAHGFTFFDRGVPDIIAYMQKESLIIPHHYHDKVSQCIYFSTVFIVPPWKEIYKNDAQRMEDYETALTLHDYITETYKNLGYQTLILPKVSVQERADFILQQLSESRN
jgi:predicted ATPase